MSYSHREVIKIASHSFHKPKALCVVCVLNTLNEAYYLLLDTQPEIEKLRPNEEYAKFSDEDASIKILDSSCGLAMHYLLTNLQNSELSEFEAYLSVARNLIEKVSRFIDVTNDISMKKLASKDFEKTWDDLTLLFETQQARPTAKQIKQAQWLGRGVNKANIEGDVYELIYAYISRVIHVSNMDTLLTPEEDRFFAKAYLLVTVSKLYHKYIINAPYLTDEARALHKRCFDLLDEAWRDKGVTPEAIIYCTSFYDDLRPKLEAQKLEAYRNSLKYTFELFLKDSVHVLPKFEIMPKINSKSSG